MNEEIYPAVLAGLTTDETEMMGVMSVLRWWALYRCVLRAITFGDMSNSQRFLLDGAAREIEAMLRRKYPGVRGMTTAAWDAQSHD